jgi:hypothetical protein
MFTTAAKQTTSDVRAAARHTALQACSTLPVLRQLAEELAPRDRPKERTSGRNVIPSLVDEERTLSSTALQAAIQSCVLTIGRKKRTCDVRDPLGGDEIDAHAVGPSSEPDRADEDQFRAALMSKSRRLAVLIQSVECVSQAQRNRPK